MSLFVSGVDAECVKLNSEREIYLSEQRNAEHFCGTMRCLTCHCGCPCVCRAGTNTIVTDCTSQRNTQYNHFSYPVCNSD